MSVTLDRIYYTAMRKYKMKLVAGSGGIWGQVTWIHQVEDKDVIGFLKGGELVVITGITNIGSESLFDYTEQLISKEACGLIINIGPYIKSVPGVGFKAGRRTSVSGIYVAMGCSSGGI